MIAGSTLLNLTTLFWLATLPFIALAGKKINHKYPSIILFLGGTTMLVGAVLGWSKPESWVAPLPIFLAITPLANNLDGLSAVFIGLLAIITIAIALFSPGYLHELNKTSHPACYWVELFLFIIGMLGVLLGANAASFLLSWEVMALSSLLLICTNLTSHEARSAAFIYLGATRTATTLLLGGFFWMYKVSHSWDFNAWNFADPHTLLPALMIMIGLFIKAGVWPFQDWLPHAHPAAPSPVSALMSGIMIETALYAVIRILVMHSLVSPVVAYTMLALGLISAFWGVLLALLQNDLKVLLAYSSIENVGLIVVGIATFLIGRICHQPIVMSWGLGAAIFHCLNHGLFKSLLFLVAGAIDSRTHTRNIEQLGGLGKTMPWTMLSFVIGSVAICALPPLNGFNSKWLIYQGLFQLAILSGNFWMGSLAIISIGALGLVSGLAVATFSKAIGITFLGRPRTSHASKATEITVSMRLAMGLLVLGCVLFGVGPQLAIGMIRPICIAAKAGGLMSFPIPIATLAIATIGMASFLFFYWLRSNKPELRRYITWECGFGDLTERMQPTGASFSENVAYTFAPLVEYHLQSTIAGRDRRHFPEAITMRVTMASVLESKFYRPIVQFIKWLGEHMLLLQAGSVHLYLVYILITLVLLMVVGILT
jgi:formate hydrogenlyase subunit 3/multisubunit Na+/H+ antiporter MnhD subunit